MSLSQVQALAAHALVAVASGKNLSDELAHIIAHTPELTAQDKGMLQDIAYGCQRHLGSLKFMLGKMLNCKATCSSPFISSTTRQTRRTPWSTKP